MSIDYPKGSEWRKWDLHVHTPASALNNQFGNDWDKYVKALFSEAITKKIACIGITDYFSIEGYKKIKTEYLDSRDKLEELFSEEIKDDAAFLDKVESILLLPNVELRLSNVLSKDDKTHNSKFQYHVIFSNELTPNQIEDNFLCQLHFSADSSAQIGIDHPSLTRSNLERLGERLKQEQGFPGSDYYVGCMNAAIEFSELSRTLKNVENAFKNKFLFVLPEEDITEINWNDQCHNVRKVIYASSHLIFSSSRKTKEWGLLEETKTEFSSLKGCIWGSDAHEYEKLFEPDLKRYCWIKADPTFRGLYQVAIHPGDRVFIGTPPPAIEAVARKPRSFIDSATIKKIDDAKNPETWFDTDLPLNAGLVAIIGNKGSGKSALSDIIGYLGHSPNFEKFSFLHKERFQKSDKKFAADYCGRIIWADGYKIEEENLLSHVVPASIEYVKYLPQKFIESVCNDINDEFQLEINQVIFSFIAEAEKGSARNLTELFKRKCKDIESDDVQKRQQIREINEAIILLEDKSAPKYEKDCVEKKNRLEEELKRHEANVPQAVPNPAENQSEDSEKAKRIAEIEVAVQSIDVQIAASLKRYKTVTDTLDEIQAIESAIKLIEVDAASVNDRFLRFASTNNIDHNNKLVEIKSNMGSLLAFKKSLEDEKNDLALQIRVMSPEMLANADGESIDPSFEKSLYYKKHVLETEKTGIVSETSVEQQLYEKYKIALKVWQDDKTKLIGDENTDNSIKYFEKELKYIHDSLKKDLSDLDEKRLLCMRGLYENLQKICDVYSELYKPIQQQLASILKDVEDTFGFSAEIIAKKNLAQEILSYINKNAAGPFRTVNAATILVDKMINETTFNDANSFIDFFQNLIANIRNSFSDEISKVVANRDKLYEYICEMKYLSVEYALKLGNKSLTELSPGERGMVLLIFYLALSKETHPLIIDQPEDNLDNQSVFHKLVPCILAAKKHRQVIIVTHNPNIAVACDAEQIVFCEIDKTTSRISYSSGSIENPVMRSRVVDVLEGTAPAFDLRKSKYFLDMYRHRDS